MPFGVALRNARGADPRATPILLRPLREDWAAKFTLMFGLVVPRQKVGFFLELGWLEGKPN